MLSQPDQKSVTGTSSTLKAVSQLLGKNSKRLKYLAKLV